MRDKHLIVMLKEPRAGRVKTRLGQQIGMTAAAWWFRHQTQALLRRLDDPRWKITLAVSPDKTIGPWSIHLPRIPQGRGDLGARMGRLLRRARGPMLVIGGDIPGVSCAHIQRGFAALGGHDAVFGPALDGGYWMIGVRHGARLPRGFLRNVRWSSEHALTDSIATLPGYRIALTDQLRDVDTADDLAPRA